MSKSCGTCKYFMESLTVRGKPFKQPYGACGFEIEAIPAAAYGLGDMEDYYLSPTKEHECPLWEKE